MNINIRYLIIGGIILLILVVTHHNPVMDRKKQQALEKASHPDALVYSIEQHNKEHPHISGFRGAGGVGNSASTGAAANRIVNGPNAAAQNPNAKYQNPLMQQYYQKNAGPNGTGQPYYNGGANGEGGQGGAMQDQQNNGYYPPPPLPSNQVMPPPANGPQSLIRTNQTRSGMQLAFAGTRVYKVDSNGNWSPMPDGTYRMVTGEALVVRGGHKMIIDN